MPAQPRRQITLGLHGPPAAIGPVAEALVAGIGGNIVALNPSCLCAAKAGARLTRSVSDRSIGRLVVALEVLGDCRMQLEGEAARFVLWE